MYYVLRKIVDPLSNHCHYGNVVMASFCAVVAPNAALKNIRPLCCQGNARRDSLCYVVLLSTIHMYLGLRVKWPILSDFSPIPSSWTNFRKRTRIKFHENLSSILLQRDFHKEFHPVTESMGKASFKPLKRITSFQETRACSTAFSKNYIEFHENRKKRFSR